MFQLMQMMLMLFFESISVTVSSLPMRFSRNTVICFISSVLSGTQNRDSLGLALKALEGVGGFYLDMGIQTQHGAQCAVQLLLDALYLLEIICHGGGGKLYPDSQDIHVIIPVNDDLIVGAYLLSLEQYFLYL